MLSQSHSVSTSIVAMEGIAIAVTIRKNAQCERAIRPYLSFEFFMINDLAVSARSGRSKSEFYVCLSIDT